MKIKFNILKNKNCSYCNEILTKKSCNVCDPFGMIEGWTSGNLDIDKFIKDTIYDVRNSTQNRVYEFLEWVASDRFKDIKEIGKGGFSKVYSATWIDGKSEYYKNDGNYKKEKSKPMMKVALKSLNGSQYMSNEYLNELKIHWNITKIFGLSLYGITKDKKTQDFMMILEFAQEGSLKSILSRNFKNTLWKNKIKILHDTLVDLQKLHELGYFHKDFHSGNILQVCDDVSYISDFGLSGPANEQKSDKNIYGVMPYVAPEVLNGKPYMSSSDIYSVGVIMAELSSGKPPFYDKKHDLSLTLAICNGLRPEFGKGTPEFYMKLACKCMNGNSDERPTAKDLVDIFKFWYSTISAIEVEKFGYEGKEIKEAFNEADKEIPNISTSYEMNSGSVYVSRPFKSYNDSLLIPVDNNEDHDSNQSDLEIPQSIHN
ncbi:hypothetical protein RclHR1_01410001 [Rhizophagus clarus]|uniref:Kinase-like domain-containing protein n=1 Tax=Rhizophagus clarus TaxID=94130 RepID=A0A2Z6R4C0_9GLOM|nr:hypothetical protein RclHR1_01410001 [Rhizophagus clarus]GES74722.1 kinase-like domain-containing protein [Rhizophagus clarus]